MTNRKIYSHYDDWLLFTLLHFLIFQQHACYSHTSWHKLTFLLFSLMPSTHMALFLLLVFLPCCEEGLLFHFAVEVSPHWTTVSGNLLQTPAAACPGIGSRCLCTYACHVVSAPRCTLMLWVLMVAYSLLIAMIAILRYSAECVLWACPSRYGSMPELTG